MSDKKEIRATVEAKTSAFIGKYADKYGLGVGEAIDKLINTAASRLAALARYAKNTKADAPPKEKKPKAAKKPAKPKAEGGKPKKKAASKPKKKAAEAPPAEAPPAES